MKSNGKIKIEKGIPMPFGASNNHYPLDKMDIIRLWLTAIKALMWLLPRHIMAQGISQRSSPPESNLTAPVASGASPNHHASHEKG